MVWNPVPETNVYFLQVKDNLKIEEYSKVLGHIEATLNMNIPKKGYVIARNVELSKLKVKAFKKSYGFRKY